VQVVHGFPVGVVVECLAQLVQPRKLGMIQLQRLCGTDCRLHQVVAKCRDYGPQPEFAGEVAVDNETGADIVGSINVAVESRMLRQLAGKMVIEIVDLRAIGERALNSARICAQ